MTHPGGQGWVGCGTRALSSGSLRRPTPRICFLATSAAGTKGDGGDSPVHTFLFYFSGILRMTEEALVSLPLPISYRETPCPQASHIAGAQLI